jgi:hypothetical protein
MARRYKMSHWSDKLKKLRRARREAKIEKEFEERAKFARVLKLSEDVWSIPARDMLRIYAFAGFDTKKIIRKAVLLASPDGLKINLPTVEKAWAKCYKYDGGKYVEL